MTERYRLSFTTGGLFLQESAIATASFLQLGEWTATRAQLRVENLLQVRTSAAATRISKEVTARLQELSSEELSALLDLSLRDQANLLWVAVCRRYLYMHLMERDHKPFKYVVLLGLDAFDPEHQKAIMFGFKDRLLADIREESFEAWKRKHIADCVVLSVESWNKYFPDWPLRREAPAKATVSEGVAQ